MKNWPLILGLTATAGVLVIVAMAVSCDQAAVDAPDELYHARFTAERYEPSGTQCYAHVITDKETGCQYLQFCNDIAPMPHTCFLDKAIDQKVLGVQ